MRTTRMNLRDSDRYNEVGMFPNQRFARGISWVALVSLGWKPCIGTEESSQVSSIRELERF